MLIGEPASGKTMIANLLALSAGDEWELQTLILSSSEDLDRQWNPDDPGQFFWVDDAFGSNHCDFNRVQEWNQRLPKLKAAIHKGARVIFTSRSYIFRAAQSNLNTNKFELFSDIRVTIEVEKLSEAEKAMILYNHLKLGKQRHFEERLRISCLRLHLYQNSFQKSPGDSLILSLQKSLFATKAVLLIFSPNQSVLWQTL